MDLNYGAEYEDFRKDVQAFCNAAWTDANKTAYKTWAEANG